MELANCWLTLDKQGSNIPLYGVSPAELVYLVKNRKHVLGRFPITDLKIVRKINISDDIERKRLQMKYGRVKSKEPGEKPFNIDMLYPEHTSRFPQVFKDTGLLEEAEAIKVGSDKVVEAPDDSQVPATVQSETYWADVEAEKKATAEAKAKEPAKVLTPA